MADAISIEETNKLRLSLGLKPLPVPGGGPAFKAATGSDSEEEEDQGSTLETRAAEGYGNWQKHQEEAEVKKKRRAKLDAIKKERDAAQRFVKLEGKGLGDGEDGAGEVDTKTWLIQQKKRQKHLAKERERARKMEEELREREQQAYTSKDLAGVKVAHELGDFEDDQGEHVLTLKDATIEENEEEGDELEDLRLRENEKLGERLDLKKRKPVYNPNDVDEGGEKVLLQHYDEVIDGKKRKRFTIDAEGSTVDERRTKQQAVGDGRRPQAVSLDILKELPASDYQDLTEVKIKKPKKKKAKSTRQKVYDEDDIDPTRIGGATETPHDAMEVDSTTSAVKPTRRMSVALIDDDDLQASLARQRREALKKRRKLKPEDLARQIREEASATPADISNEEDGEPGLIIDETSEFVANLQRPKAVKARATPAAPPNGYAPPTAASPAGGSDAEDDDDVEMERSYNEVEDAENAGARIKSENGVAGTEITETGLEEESALTRGLASTLGLLTQRGLVQRTEGGEQVARFREKQRFLTEKQKRESAAEAKARSQRERDRTSGKLERMSAREREQHAQWENRQRDQAESRQMTEIFNKEYRPDVQLKYVDEFGRAMNQKEAFKHLSHQFHGKGSGKQKTEKRLKKIDEENKKEAQSVLDVSQAGLINAQGATSKKNRQPGVRLA